MFGRPPRIKWYEKLLLFFKPTRLFINDGIRYKTLFGKIYVLEYIHEDFGGHHK